MTIVHGRRGVFFFLYGCRRQNKASHWGIVHFIAMVSEASLTLTELPVLGDHLAVAGVAVAGVGAVAVDASAFAFARVVLALVYVYMADRDRKDE